MKDKSAIKGNLSQKNAFLVVKQGLMGIRPNKANFGLSFGHFGSKKRDEERRREEEEKNKQRRKGMELGFCKETMFLYGFMTLSMET